MNKVFTLTFSQHQLSQSTFKDPGVPLMQVKISFLHGKFETTDMQLGFNCHYEMYVLSRIGIRYAGPSNSTGKGPIMIYDFISSRQPITGK